jgi:hypothetical protein
MSRNAPAEQVHTQTAPRGNVKALKTTFFSLPLELRNQIYIDYLENAKKEPSYQKCAAINSFVTILKPCQCQTKTIKMWSPLGFTYLTDAESCNHNGDVYYAPNPAIWDVGGVLGKEAKEAYLNSRLLLDFTLRTSYTALPAVLQKWRHSMTAADIASIRLLHVNFSFLVRKDPGLEQLTSQERNLRTAFPTRFADLDRPLFKIECRDEGRTLRVHSRYPLIDQQHDKLQKSILGLGLPRGTRFDGSDILAVVNELLVAPTMWVFFPRSWDGPKARALNMWIVKEVNGMTGENMWQSQATFGVFSVPRLSLRTMSVPSVTIAEIMV